jgi:mRNA interferase RelE/StbE
MAKYKLEISRTAEKQLKKLPKGDQVRVVTAILSLASTPFPPGMRKLSGYDDVYRIRVGNYRILYSVSATALIIIILKVGHRKDIYR